MKTKSMKCPCEDCLCVPICRNKDYFSLSMDCSLIDNYIKEYEDNQLQIINNILKPSQWKVTVGNNLNCW